MFRGFPGRLESCLALRGLDLRVSFGTAGELEFMDALGNRLPLRVKYDLDDAKVEPTEPGVSGCRTRLRADVIGLCDDAERVIRALRPEAPGIAIPSR
jgi:hypothetical protein